MKEKNKIEVIQAIMDRRIEVREAGRVLKRSQRQVYRLLRRMREKGLEGMIHGNRGRESPRKIKENIRSRVLLLARGKLKDINDTHLAEILEREEGILMGRETLRRILRKEKIGPKHKKKRSKYRSRRERKESFGMMIQIDASHHDWLEGRGPQLVLVGGIDDATGYAWARFECSETCWGYLRLIEQIALSHGLPLSLYSDRHTIFHSPKEPTIIEQIQNIRPLTQFGRAMDELGVTMIPAYSAPAKGRIERLWGTFQDRLIVEMRLAGISTKQQAEMFLGQFLKQFNQRFTVKPKNRDKLFRHRLPVRDLNRILCLKETRTVRKDHTVSFEGVVFQIPPSSKWASIANQKVQVLQLKDQSIEIIYKKQIVAKFSPEAAQRIIEQYKQKNSLLEAA